MKKTPQEKCKFEWTHREILVKDDIVKKTVPGPHLWSVDKNADSLRAVQESLLKAPIPRVPITNNYQYIAVVDVYPTYNVMESSLQEPYMDACPIDVDNKMEITDLLDKYDYNILPLEWFDNRMYRENWKIDKDSYNNCNAILSHISSKEFSKSLKIMKVDIRDYNPVTGKWRVFRRGTKIAKISEIFIFFPHVNVGQFMLRLEYALKFRKQSERYRRFFLSTACLKFDQLDAQIVESEKKRIFGLVKYEQYRVYQKKRYPPDASNVPLTFQSLNKVKSQVDLEFQRCANRIKMVALYGDYLQLPKFEKLFNWYVVHYETFTNYIKLRLYHRAKTLLATPECIRLSILIQIELLKFDEMALFPITKYPLTLDDFKDIQMRSFKQMVDFLQLDWPNDTSQMILTVFEEVIKGWYNTNVFKWDIFDITKYDKLIYTIQFRMQWYLRSLIERSVTNYLTYLCEPCRCVLHLEDDFEWWEDLIFSPFITPKTRPAFKVVLQIGVQGPHYSTDPAEFGPAILWFYDNVLLQTHFIPKVCPIIISQLIFEPHIHLTSIGLMESIIADSRDFIELCYKKIVIPLNAYARRYQQHVAIYLITVDEFMEYYRVVERPSREIEAQIHFQIKERVYVEETVPLLILIGSFRVETKQLRTLLIDKRQLLADTLLMHLKTQLDNQICEYIAKFSVIFNRLKNPCSCIEEQLELAIWVLEVPEIVNQLEQKMQLKLFEYTILDQFFCALSDEEFCNKYTAMGFPFRIANQRKITMNMHQEEIERFSKIQTVDLTRYEELFIDFNVRVSKWFKRFDTDNEIGFAADVKSLWEGIQKCRALGKKLSNRQLCFEEAELVFDNIDSLLENFHPYLILWTSAAQFKEWQDDLILTPILELDMDVVKQTMLELRTGLALCVESFNDYEQMQEVAQHFVVKVDEFQNCVDVLDWIKCYAWLSIHWTEFNKTTGMDIIMSSVTNFRYLLDKNILDYSALVQEISERALREKIEMERRLQEERELQERLAAELQARRNARRGRKI